MKKTIQLIKFLAKYGAYIYVIFEVLQFAADRFEKVAKEHGEDIEQKPEPLKQQADEVISQRPIEGSRVEE